MLLVSTRDITAKNTKVLQQASLLADNPRSTRISIDFHTKTHVLIPDDDVM